MTNADGQLLAGRYRLTGLVGQGGMGAVWRAHDEQLDREVAVKELRLPEHLDGAARRTWIARLDREARAAARLRHPGIVTVHDRVTGEDGRPWIVMELVRGQSLADLLKTQGPLPSGRVAQIGLQMLDALRAAHQAGITHRDIKPANVLLEDDRVVLTDFGIAAFEGDTTLTATGAVIGTPAYMSPEQVRGRQVTAASDLWSLGVTLYAAVEGRLPFEGAGTGAIFVAIATEDPAPPTLAGPLEPVLRTLLQRDPEQRPTADQLHAQLAGLTQDHLLRPPAEPLIAQPTDPLPDPARLRKKTVGRPVLAAVIAALVLIALAAPVIQDWRENVRYAANKEALEKMGTIPGQSTRLTDGGDGKVHVNAVLCDTRSASNSGECDPDSLVTAVVKWFSRQPNVQVVQLKDQRGKCTEVSPYMRCEISVLTQGSPKISDVFIRSSDGSNPGAPIRFDLYFILG